ncbi:hypothetical protein LPICM02_100017 [Pseudolactococcus piscium]|nr:hypothetical protein LPICM02_100017 [Lactococcus piscium]
MHQRDIIIISLYYSHSILLTDSGVSQGARILICDYLFLIPINQESKEFYHEKNNLHKL